MGISHGDFPRVLKNITKNSRGLLRNNFPQVYKQTLLENWLFYFKVVEERRAIQDVQVRYLREYFYKRA